MRFSNYKTVLPMTGDAAPEQRLRLEDTRDFSQIRFMESYESRHSDFEFTGRLAAALGVTRPALRIDSQAKYGAYWSSQAALIRKQP